MTVPRPAELIAPLTWCSGIGRAQACRALNGRSRSRLLGTLCPRQMALGLSHSGKGRVVSVAGASLSITDSLSLFYAVTGAEGKTVESRPHHALSQSQTAKGLHAPFRAPSLIRASDSPYYSISFRE